MLTQSPDSQLGCRSDDQVRTWARRMIARLAGLRSMDLPGSGFDSRSDHDGWWCPWTWIDQAKSTRDSSAVPMFARHTGRQLAEGSSSELWPGEVPRRAYAKRCDVSVRAARAAQSRRTRFETGRHAKGCAGMPAPDRRHAGRFRTYRPRRGALGEDGPTLPAVRLDERPPHRAPARPGEAKQHRHRARPKVAGRASLIATAPNPSESRKAPRRTRRRGAPEGFLLQVGTLELRLRRVAESSLNSRRLGPEGECDSHLARWFQHSPRPDGDPSGQRAGKRHNRGEAGPTPSRSWLGGCCRAVQ